MDLTVTSIFGDEAMQKWEYKQWKRNRLDRQRRERLTDKLMKAHATELEAMILTNPSWNKRFAAVARLYPTRGQRCLT